MHRNHPLKSRVLPRWATETWPRQPLPPCRQELLLSPLYREGYESSGWANHVSQDHICNNELELKPKVLIPEPLAHWSKRAWIREGNWNRQCGTVVILCALESDCVIPNLTRPLTSLVTVGDRSPLCALVSPPTQYRLWWHLCHTVVKMSSYSTW